MKEIFFYFISKFADSMPSFILSRLLPPDQIKQKIDINLRNDNPINFDFAAQNPNVDIWFEIVNRSSLNIVLDRLLIEVWFGQPTFSASVLHRYDIPRTEKVDNIRYWQNLTTDQIKLIKWCLSTTKGQVRIYLTAYFESKAGKIILRKDIERNLNRTS